MATIPGPQVSIGNLLAGRHVSDEEFLADDSPWVVVTMDDAAFNALKDLLDPITPDQQAAWDELHR